MSLDKHSKVFVAGHRGMVGSAIAKQLHSAGYGQLLTADRAELDLLDQHATAAFLKAEQPDAVIVAAARVGGINANNTYPAEFIYQNLVIETNLIHGAYESGIKRLVFLGSSCIYPKHADQPMRESALLTGPLEPTNEPYAIAKIAGIKLCESFNRQYGTDYRSLMPTNLYGPNDNFNLENSHVIPALIQKFHTATENGKEAVEIWGTGSARREFLHVDDMARAAHHFLELDQETIASSTDPMLSHINIGTGKDVSIRELAEMIQSVTGFEGQLRFNTSMPDGTPLKRLDVSLAARLGWAASTDLRSGLEQTYRWFLTHRDSIRQQA